MKSTPSELISTFRKKITLTSALGITLSILGFVLLFVIELAWVQENRSGLIAPFLFVVFYFWERNITYREILEGNPEEVIQKLEEHLDEKDHASKKRDWLRIFLLSLVVLGLIVSLIIPTETYWTSFLLMVFVVAVLFVIIERWLRMTARFMLQDLKHSLREHHIEPS